MKPSSPHTEPLPRVPAPVAWLWHYFRVRYLPATTSVLAAVTVIWLWSVNLPETDDNPTSTAGLITNAPALAASETNVAVAEFHVPVAGQPAEASDSVPLHD